MASASARRPSSGESNEARIRSTAEVMRLRVDASTGCRLSSSATVSGSSFDRRLAHPSITRRKR
ncbi:MAG: hypothetical protein L0Y66_16880, partial [Myxococcaceae bacterium]|nr:hypothetical protein [Myxococcaceae bacterium]